MRERDVRPFEYEDEMDLLLKTASDSDPGITFIEFTQLFGKCKTCSLIMTRSTLREHRCRNSDDVIDLTLDDSD
jgi:hypothetical protein